MQIYTARKDVKAYRKLHMLGFWQLAPFPRNDLVIARGDVLFAASTIINGRVIVIGCVKTSQTTLTLFVRKNIKSVLNVLGSFVIIWSKVCRLFLQRINVYFFPSGSH